MDRTLEIIHENETVHITSSSDTTSDDLHVPTVTPKQRSFADTVNKQNRENKALREKLLREKIAQLEEQLYATEQALDYNASDPNGG
jgi:3-methyladenine DNA glycosylase AlkC